MSNEQNKWNNSDGYELYVGRWSRLLSVDFLSWLNPGQEMKWFEIGCGTGALTEAILRKYDPVHVLAMDKSKAYLDFARLKNKSGNVSFLESDLNAVDLADAEFDHITSGLVLNFIPQPEIALGKVMKNLKKGGRFSAFVWDYAGHYQPMRHFWNVAKEVSSAADKYDAGEVYTLCRKEGLLNLATSLGLTDIEITDIERIALFRDFDNYWEPIVTAQGSVTEFIASSSNGEVESIRERLKQRLPIASNGEIKLVINALAVKGLKK
jgi:SAM-dependent methyltransferase